MINKKELALGKGLPSEGVAEAQDPKDLTVEERLALLEEKYKAMSIAFNTQNKMLAKKEQENEVYTEVFGAQPKNHEGVPLNMSLIGITRGIPYILIVDEFGRYSVGNDEYQSLSAAAEAVSGVRRSGWTFWKTSDGRTAKEAFGKK